MAEPQIGVIGAGGWGTALGNVLADKFPEVYLWAREEEVIESIKAEKRNLLYLPNVILNDNIIPTNDINKVASSSDLLVFALPSEHMAKIARTVVNTVNHNTIILNIGKGFDPQTGLRLSQVLENLFPHNSIVALSGPNHAEETGNRMPAATVVASHDPDAALWVQKALMTNYFRIYTSEDLTGVEIGGALKNIIAIAAGILFGLELGDNAMAALMTRGLSEIRRLGLVLGAKGITFSGLSGVGDLIVTCTSRHSRNRRCGEALGKGMKLEDYLAQTKMAVEGVSACRIAYMLSQKYEVRMPITTALYQVLEGKIGAKEAAEMLMSGEERPEVEEIV